MSYQDQSPRIDAAGLAFPTTNDLPVETRHPVVALLNQSLADTTDLASQMKFAHWNVKGMNFYQLHLLFDEVAEVLEEHADMLAERATSLGGQARGTVRMAAADSRISEIPPSTVIGPAFVEATTERVGAHAANLRAAIDVAAEHGDEDTADLYTELSREVDQQLYFLESHLQTEPVGTVEEAAGQATGTTPQSEGAMRGQQPQSSAAGAPRQRQRTTFTGVPQQERRATGQGPPGGAQGGHPRLGQQSGVLSQQQSGVPPQ